MKKIFLSVITALVFAVAAQAQAQSLTPAQKTEYKAEVKRMFNLSDMETVMTGGIELALNQAPELGFSKEQIKALSAECAKTILPDVLDIMETVCMKYYTLEDMKNINKFYATPTGQKVCRSMNKIMEDVQNSMSKPEIQEKLTPVIMKYIK